MNLQAFSFTDHIVLIIVYFVAHNLLEFSLVR